MQLFSKIYTCKLLHLQGKPTKVRFSNEGKLSMAQHQQNKVRLQLRMSSVSLLCVSMLAVLALLSIFMGPLLDLDQFPHPSLVHRRSLTLKKQPEHLQTSLSNTSNVPTQADIWKSKFSEFYYGCSDSSTRFAPAVPEKDANGYLMIAASGGLNQQRTGITDAVVVARILNATLVIPELDHHSFWKDRSDFADIFDVGWFISSLLSDVTIVKEVPEKVMQEIERPYTMRVPRKSSQHFYHNRVLPMLLSRRVVKLTKFDYRLANKLDADLQKLRCRVNYHALQFTKPIQEMGQILVNRMRNKSRRFLAIHLRFEPDMLAFSGCYYGGGEKERRELGVIRKRWKTLPEANPERERRHGKCPLTPEEVGLMLRALGFGNDSYIYVASGEVYGGEETLKPLKALFPNFYTKDTLSNSRELEPFSAYSSRMAALDYIVCDQSDVFVTNNNGNMARILAGRRRFFGHKRTIRPYAKKLNSLFLNRHNMSWDTFAKKVQACQKGFMGEPNEARPGRGGFHEFPSACICEKPDAGEKIKEIIKQSKSKKKQAQESAGETVELHSENGANGSNDTDPLMDDSEDGTPRQQQLNHDMNSEEVTSTEIEDPEIEELLSD
ncbi:O-fucosyltransferase 29 isoform X2 [Cryptomeria japonica]|uniref:O-fucosyltransferase 29 isoform X2 n=1 Tax=Cryptomeria japonica TaxID=3369 RepID=UPI0027DA05CF|nr:O-fucosyltransferase 29 isoform X2 [Cryptomeria japonica]